MKNLIIVGIVGLLTTIPFYTADAGVGSPDGAIQKAKALVRNECLPPSQKSWEMFTLAAIAKCSEGPYWYVAVTVQGRERKSEDIPVKLATVRFYCDGSEEVICE